MKRYLDKESELSFYHIIIKVPDNTHGNHEFAFNSTHKKHLKELLFCLEGIYELTCLCYTIMSTHAHFIICHEKNALNKLSLKDTAKREQQYRGRRYPLDARSCEIREFRSRLNNLSDFMSNLQKRFTRWYNRQGEKSRRGQLFNHNFKSVLLKDSKALIQCMQYVEMNAVRSQMVKFPQDYEFSSWSDILKHNAIGNKLRRNINSCLRRFNGGIQGKSDQQVFNLYAARLKLVCRALLELGSFRKLDQTIVDELYCCKKKWSQSLFVSSA